MRLRQEAKVGLIVFLALVAVGVIYTFFGGMRLSGGYYTISAEFDDVLRLQRGADVRLSGVRIGYVDNIGLTAARRADVKMIVSSRYKNAISIDSTARITTGGLVGVGEYYVEILPGTSKKILKPGQTMKSMKLPNVDDIMTQVTDIIAGLNSSVDSVNEILEDPKMRKALDNILGNVEITTERTAALAADVQRLLAENRPEIDGILRDVGNAANDFAQVTKEVRLALQSGGTQQVQAALASAARAAENLEMATKRIRELAEDENISADIKETLSNARQASEDAASVASKLKDVFAGRIPKAGGPRKGPIPGEGARLDVLAGSKVGDLRLDYNYTFPGNGNSFYRAGLYNLGDNTKLNLQLGEILSERSAFRYGLYASKLDIGYDWIMKDNMSLQLDLFSPNDPRLEALFRYDFSPNMGALLGIEDLFGDTRGMVGLQYHK